MPISTGPSGMGFNFSRDECLNLESSLKKEWLETNGLGGYASSTVLDCHTRKYHGLLVASVPQLNAKCVFLSKLETSVRIKDRVFELSTNKFPGVFHPTGHKYLKQVSITTHPTIFYQMGNTILTREILMIQGENTILVRYELKKSDEPLTLCLKPYLAYRNIHELSRENIYLRVKTFIHSNYYKLDPYSGMPPLFFDTSPNSQYFPGPFWICNVEYLKERSRGFDYQEDLFCPGVLECEIKPKQVLFFRASLDKPQNKIKDVWQKELRLREKDWARFKRDSNETRMLKYKSSQFFIKNSRNNTSLVAGYHWFNEWGRDAMIALPGLTLTCGREKLALEVLKTFASYEKEGIIPNNISIDGKEKATNSVDASLWTIWAVKEYIQATSDYTGIKKEIFPTMRNILRAFLQNKFANTSLKENGLLWVGDNNTQLTWMDAKVDNQPITPRFGFAVEINALWFEVLCFYKKIFEKILKKKELEVDELIKRVASSFVQTFWIPEKNYLADVVNHEGIDASIRPNQIIAVSMDCSPLSLVQKSLVVDCVKRHLLTPVGLRTLSPSDIHYCGEYKGGPSERDKAYHQGTVWPWLIEFYVKAALNTATNPSATKKELKKYFQPLFSDHLKTACVGGISEIFNGSSPQWHKGCMHQAWSVAGTLRALEML